MFKIHQTNSIVSIEINQELAMIISEIKKKFLNNLIRKNYINRSHKNRKHNGSIYRLEV